MVLRHSGASLGLIPGPSFRRINVSQLVLMLVATMEPTANHRCSKRMAEEVGQDRAKKFLRVAQTPPFSPPLARLTSC